MSPGAPEHPAIRWRSALLGPNDLKPTSKLVGFAIAHHINSVSAAMNAGAARLASLTNLTERAITMHLQSLSAAGYLDLLEQGGQPGGPRTSTWRAAIPGMTWHHQQGWTPEPRSGVTQEPRSGVLAMTPEPDAPTPEPDAPTPERRSPELEELDRPEGRALVRRAAHEVDGALAKLRATYNSSVDQVLAELTAAGYVTDWPSQLAADVEQRCAARRRAQAEQPRTPASERWEVTDPDDDPSAPPVARPRPAA